MWRSTAAITIIIALAIIIIISNFGSSYGPFLFLRRLCSSTLVAMPPSAPVDQQMLTTADEAVDAVAQHCSDVVVRMQNLRNHVAFLQQTIEGMRLEIDSLRAHVQERDARLVAQTAESRTKSEEKEQQIVSLRDQVRWRDMQLAAERAAAEEAKEWSSEADMGALSQQLDTLRNTLNATQALLRWVACEEGCARASAAQDAGVGVGRDAAVGNRISWV